MTIDATERRKIEQFFFEKLAECHDHHHIRLPFAYLRESFRRVYILWSDAI
jgi:hypothetical protein